MTLISCLGRIKDSDCALLLLLPLLLLLLFSSFAACTVQGSERQPVPWEGGGGVEASHYLTGTEHF